MNLTIDQLPAHCDVLVVGAGPAGSAAATLLARGGLDVVLIDQHAFPRDKVCGDGLIPDAHRALHRLGLLDEVMGQAQPVTHAGLISPRGIRVDVPGTLAVLPRRILDEIVCRGALRAGARMFAPLRFVAPLEDGGRVVGARLAQGEAGRELRCGWVVLASGAQPQALIAAGMALRQRASGVALRGYVRNEAMRGRIDKLEVVWHRAVAPGYGWIFPCRDAVFNVGVGAFTEHDLNLRALFEAFTRIYPAARELVAGGQWLAPPKGALLARTIGDTPSKPGSSHTFALGIPATALTYCMPTFSSSSRSDIGRNARPAVGDVGVYAAPQMSFSFASVWVTPPMQPSAATRKLRFIARAVAGTTPISRSVDLSRS